MEKKSGGYFNLGYILSVIFAIIPITNLVLGVLTRAKRKNVLGAVLNIILFPIFYVADIITIITKNKIVFLA